MRSLAPALEAFQNMEGFEQRALMATLAPPPRSASRGDILRSIQCEEEGAFAFIRLLDSPRSNWIRRYERSLVKAGYRERGVRGPDEIAMQRWLTNNDDIMQELQFFACLEDEDGLLALPRRSPKQHVTRQRRRSNREWISIFETIRYADASLDSCAIGFQRQRQLRVDSKIAVTMTAYAMRDAGYPLRIDLLVNLSANSLDARKALHALEIDGYERSKYNALCVMKGLRRVSQSTRECERVFAELT